MPLVTSRVAKLTPYPPGKPIEELERELGITGSIKLASNENPLGPSPKAMAAIRKHLAKLHRYPDGSAYYLKDALAAKIGVPVGSLILGNGSNEVIDLAVRTFLSPGDEAVLCEPTFLMYRKFLEAHGCKAKAVGLTKDLRIDLAAMLRVGKKARLFFINNPNNPTGTTVTRAEFDGFLANVPRGAIVLLDEAYIDFADDSSDTPRGLEYALRDTRGKWHVIALRTFSKMYGLAGLRIGYGVAAGEIISFMDRVRQPFNVNSLAQVAALAALGDDRHYNRTLKLTRDGLKYLQEGVTAMGLKFVPTQANFFLVDVGDGQAVYEKMLRLGVIIRSMKSYGLPRYVRISAGLPGENERCLAGLRQVLGK